MEASNLDVDKLLPYIVQMARLHRGMYEAYVEQGFSEEQATFFIGQHLSAITSRKVKKT